MCFILRGFRKISSINHCVKVLALSIFITSIVFTNGAFLSVCGLLIIAGHFISTLSLKTHGDVFFGRYLNNDRRNEGDATNDLHAERFCKTMPWNGLKIPPSVNDKLEEFIEKVINYYVNSWYETEISDDVSFVNELRYQIRYASSIIFQKLRDFDFVSFVLTEALPLIAIHVERVLKLGAEFDGDNFSFRSIDAKILETLTDLHFALGSREDEINYLRQVADHFVGCLFDESRVAGRSSDKDFPVQNSPAYQRPWPSHDCRHFLREILVFYFFAPALDTLADPDTFNSFLIWLFDSDKLSETSTDMKEEVEFLQGFIKCIPYDKPNSLLQLKLSEIIRSTRYFEIFSMYVKDMHGPVNDLSFITNATNIHENMLNSKKNVGLLNEMWFEISILFSKFVHFNGDQKIDLPSILVIDFQQAIEIREFELLDHCLETAYQIVYTRLQRDYVVPFCQSDCFFGYLCGSPPISVGELITRDDKNGTGRRTIPYAEPAFTLSQFRMRFWKVVMPSREGTNESFHESNADDNYTYEKFLVVKEQSMLTENEVFSDKGVDIGIENGSVERNIHCFGENSSSFVLHESAGNTSCQAGVYEWHVIDASRDINRWIVTIPCTQSFRDPITGRLMYLFTICIERYDKGRKFTDCGDTLEKSIKWSINRRYNEFFVLESKLLEFHGDLIKTDPLPPRKPFRVKNYYFMESHRPIFEHFLQLLTRQSLLKRSDLLCAFLTDEQEFKYSINLSGLNPWNMVRKVPSKFTRERGQNLKPFILSLMSKTIIVQPESAQGLSGSSLSCREKSESSSLSSFCCESGDKVSQYMFSTLYGNNSGNSNIDLNNVQSHFFWTRSFSDSIMYLFARLFALPDWAISILITLQFLLGTAVDGVIYTFVQRFFRKRFTESNFIQIIQLIDDSVFAADSASSTQQVKSLRAKMAQRLCVQYLQEQLLSYYAAKFMGHKQFQEKIQLVFKAFQYPRLNKQLSFVLFDVIMGKIFKLTSS